MTYSNKATRNAFPVTPSPDPKHAIYIAGVSPAIQAVIAQLLLWLTDMGASRDVRANNRYDRAAGTAKTAAVISALVMVMICLPGSLKQKQALFDFHTDAVIAKVQAKLAPLKAKYIIWRQRQCWMWGGGFTAAALEQYDASDFGARDEMSFDTLIPN